MVIFKRSHLFENIILGIQPLVFMGCKVSISEFFFKAHIAPEYFTQGFSGENPTLQRVHHCRQDSVRSDEVVLLKPLATWLIWSGFICARV